MMSNRFSRTVLVLLAPLCAPGPTRSQERTPDDLTQTYIRKAIEEDRKVQALNRAREAYEQHRANANHTDDKLRELSDLAEKHYDRIKLLLTNEDGKRLAATAAHVAQFIDIQDHPPVRIEQIEKHRRTVTRILESLRIAPDLIQADYKPSLADAKEIERIYYWAERASDDLAGQDAQLNDMIAKAPPFSHALDATSLRQAVEQRTAFLDVLSARADVDAETIASHPSLQILIENAVQGKLEEAQARAQAALNEQRAEIERLKTQYEKRIADMQRDSRGAE